MNLTEVNTSSHGRHLGLGHEKIESKYIKNPTTLPESSACSPKDDVFHVKYRSLQLKDKTIVKDLHEKWFPVKYSDDFYSSLVQNKLVGSGNRLYSCVAYKNEQNENEENLSNDYQSWGGKNNNNDRVESFDDTKLDNIENGDTDDILGCIVGTFVETSNSKSASDLLIRNEQLHPHMFYIMTLGITDKYRKKGLGSKLVQKVIDEVEKDPQCGALYLHVITYNAEAIRFYEKLGFYRVTEIRNYYLIDDEHYNCYLYAKYFHGNWGHFTMLKVVSSIITSLWFGIKASLTNGSRYLK